MICETIDRKKICASSTLDLYLGFIASNQGSANLLQAAIHLTSTEWEMILQSLDLRTNFAEGFSWMNPWIVMETKTSKNPSEYFFVHNHGKMGSLQNKDVSCTSLGYFYFHDYGRAGSI